MFLKKTDLLIGGASQPNSLIIADNCQCYFMLSTLKGMNRKQLLLCYLPLTFDLLTFFPCNFVFLLESLMYIAAEFELVDVAFNL